MNANEAIGTSAASLLDVFRVIPLGLLLAAIGTACTSTNATPPSEGGALDGALGDAGADGGPSGPAACAAIGGKCVLGNSGCITRGTPDCNPGRNPGGAICCLDGVGNTCPDGSAQVIQASNYDQSCTKDSDCVPIAAGNVCYPCLIECANSGAINADAMSQYQADIEKTSAWTTIQSSIYSYDAHYIPCGCPFNSGPCCVAGVCQIGAACGFAKVDSGADAQEVDGSADAAD